MYRATVETVFHLKTNQRTPSLGSKGQRAKGRRPGQIVRTAKGMNTF